MKKTTLILIKLITTLLICSCSHGNTKYINPSKLIQGYKGASIKHTFFINKSKNWQLNLDSLANEISALPLSAINIRQNKEQQYQKYREAVMQQANAEQQKLDKEVLEEVNTYIKQYGKAKGYDFILGATDNGNIVYAAEGTDITEEVLKGLNQQYAERTHTKP